MVIPNSDKPVTKAHAKTQSRNNFAMAISLQYLCGSAFLREMFVYWATVFIITKLAKQNQDMPLISHPQFIIVKKLPD